MNVPVNATSSAPIRRPLAEPLPNVIEGQGFSRGPSLAGIRELTGSSGINSTTVTRAIEDLRGSGCRWPTLAIRDMTMVDADTALTADPLFHVGSDGHRGRVDVRYWYFRPELKYLTCRACSDGGDPSPIAPEAVGCQHRIPTN